MTSLAGARTKRSKKKKNPHIEVNSKQIQLTSKYIVMLNGVRRDKKTNYVEAKDEKDKRRTSSKRQQRSVAGRLHSTTVYLPGVSAADRLPGPTLSANCCQNIGTNLANQPPQKERLS